MSTELNNRASHNFERWLIKNTGGTKFVTGEDLNMTMNSTSANWWYRPQRFGAHYKTETTFMITQHGIMPIKGIK